MLKGSIRNHRFCIARLPIHRCQSNRPPWRQDTTPHPSVFTHDNFTKHTLFVIDVAKRAIKFSSIGVLILGVTAAAAFEGAHLWVENVELAPEQDEEVKRWQWNDESESWSGNLYHGGTDPGLGFKGRHIVRAAWMAYNWGVGYSTAAIGSDASGEDGLVGPAGLRVINASLQRTEDFLSSAISFAENLGPGSHLHSQTIAQLVTRHAAVLERLGTQFLQDSKAEYERAWAGFSGRGLRAARIAMKLGDINSRLGQSNDAVTWWSKALQLTRGHTLNDLATVHVIPSTPPSSPYAQRTISTIAVLLSAFYAHSGQLQKAQTIEETALAMLRSVEPVSSLVASPPHTLHTLYLLQRSSLLSIHLAEVLYMQKKPFASSIQYLTSAAESSEKVVKALTGCSFSPSEDDFAETPPRETMPLLAYTSSRSMRKSAHDLLRDARRTCAEAWNLIGILNETRGENIQVALRCYERAVHWAGAPDGQSGTMKPNGGTLESDWVMFWGNYMSAKQIVERKS